MCLIRSLPLTPQLLSPRPVVLWLCPGGGSPLRTLFLLVIVLWDPRAKSPTGYQGQEMSSCLRAAAAFKPHVAAHGSRGGSPAEGAPRKEPRGRSPAVVWLASTVKMASSLQGSTEVQRWCLPVFHSQNTSAGLQMCVKSDTCPSV